MFPNLIWVVRPRGWLSCLGKSVFVALDFFLHQSEAKIDVTDMLGFPEHGQVQFLAPG